MAKPDLTYTPLKIGNVDLVDARLFREVDLPPTPLFSELPNFFAKLDAYIRIHSSSIDLAEALYLVDALSEYERGPKTFTGTARVGFGAATGCET